MELSIIIPTLNEERYIGKLLRCLAKESYKDFEVIVVDGHSDDETKRIVRTFKGLNLKWVDAKRRNIAYQRNLGVKYATSEKLLFLDADVEFKEGFLEKSLKEARTNTIVIPIYEPRSSNIKYKIFFKFINVFFRLFSRVRPCGIGMCIFSSKRIHKKVGGFNEGLNWTEDMEYVGSSTKHFKYKILKDAIFVSVRRFEQEGTRYTMKRWLASYWDYLFNRNRSSEVEYVYGR